MTTLAKLAQIEWDQRLAFARQRVREGRWTALEADARLFPWLAIALRAGAEPTEAADLVAAVREEPDHPIQGEARFIAATRLCPTADMRAELTRARDRALAKAIAEPANRQACERSAALQFIACYLGCPPAEPITEFQEAA